MTALLTYLAGVVIGLLVMRDPWRVRVGTALVWPLGPAAFVVVVAILIVAAAILWPVPVLGGGVLIAALAWWMT
jgi:hypothetical protein